MLGSILEAPHLWKPPYSELQAGSPTVVGLLSANCQLEFADRDPAKNRHQHLYTTAADTKNLGRQGRPTDCFETLYLRSLFSVPKPPYILASAFHGRPLRPGASERPPWVAAEATSSFMSPWRRARIPRPWTAARAVLGRTLGRTGSNLKVQTSMLLKGMELDDHWCPELKPSVLYSHRQRFKPWALVWAPNLESLYTHYVPYTRYQ